MRIILCMASFNSHLFERLNFHWFGRKHKEPREDRTATDSGYVSYRVARTLFLVYIYHVLSMKYMYTYRRTFQKTYEM